MFIFVIGPTAMTNPKSRRSSIKACEDPARVVMELPYYLACKDSRESAIHHYWKTSKTMVDIRIRSSRSVAKVTVFHWCTESLELVFHQIEPRTSS